jgi:hypothetical protein
VLTAHHWRPLRSKLLLAGIGDPMGLPSMHSLLDLTESALTESMSADPEEGSKKVSEFIDQLYAPPVEPAKAKAGYKAPPSWWTEGNSDDEFDAAQRAAPR